MVLFDIERTWKALFKLKEKSTLEKHTRNKNIYFQFIDINERHWRDYETNTILVRCTKFSSLTISHLIIIVPRISFYTTWSLIPPFSKA